MTGDAYTPAGIYFGTNSGPNLARLDEGNNEGNNWSEIARHLPTIRSVEVLEPTQPASLSAHFSYMFQHLMISAAQLP